MIVIWSGHHRFIKMWFLMTILLLIFQTGQLVPTFDDLDIFGMLVACLCHDLDHRGFNNAFQVK